MTKVVIFGNGSFAQVARFYFANDSPHEVVAFTVSASHKDADEYDGLPLVPFEDVERHYPPDQHAMFVAVGYSQVNRVRARLCGEARAKGYDLVTYVSSKATHWDDTRIGSNCFVFEDNTIQPFVTIGDDCVLWSGNHIGHHATIGDHTFITSHVVVSGHTEVGSYCFLGVNSTLRDAIKIGEANVIGAGALIMKSTNDHEVYVAPRTKPIDRKSDQLGM